MIERYREWYEHERDCNEKMLAMIESVPVDRNNDPKFAQMLQLTAHLAACRENWLDRMTSGGKNQVSWWPEATVLHELRPRFALMEEKWVRYLNESDEEELARDFEFSGSDGSHFRWNIEGQVVQLVGHAFYHRGQIALLVSQLGGETVDTDYLFWAYSRDPRFGKIEP
jgi:uncharacterized damage-inducible protein DinB